MSNSPTIPPPPPGFKLDTKQDIPAPPPGFTLDGTAQKPKEKPAAKPEQPQSFWDKHQTINKLAGPVLNAANSVVNEPLIPFFSKLSQEYGKEAATATNKAFGPESQGRSLPARALSAGKSVVADTGRVVTGLLGLPPSDAAMIAASVAQPELAPVTEAYFATKGTAGLLGLGQPSSAAAAIQNPTPETTEKALMDTAMVVLPLLHATRGELKAARTETANQARAAAVPEPEVTPEAQAVRKAAYDQAVAEQPQAPVPDQTGAAVADMEARRAARPAPKQAEPAAPAQAESAPAASTPVETKPVVSTEAPKSETQAK